MRGEFNIGFFCISFIFFSSLHINPALGKEAKININLDTKKDNLLCRFVKDGLGVTLGESIALNDDVIIIKNGKKYLGVPLKHVSEKDEELIVKGLVDKRKALQMGEKWRESSFKNIE